MSKPGLVEQWAQKTLVTLIDKNEIAVDSTLAFAREQDAALAAKDERIAALWARLQMMAVSYHVIRHERTEAFVTCPEFDCVQNRAALSPKEARDAV